MSTQEKVTAIVQRVARQKVAPDSEESLFESGYLDSFALTDMVGEIEKEFALRIPDSDLSPRRFDTIARIVAYIVAQIGNR